MEHESLREWLSIHIAKNPRRVILAIILLFNLLLIAVAALVISILAPASLKDSGFGASVFYTVTMILDAGCISYVVEDVGAAGVALIVVCLLTVLIGMVTFTGAMVGYMTNTISSFVENASTGTNRLHISGHTVILNWNNRASEIVNDLIYSERPEKIVILVPAEREAVEREIGDRIADTLDKSEKEIKKACEGLTFFQRLQYRRQHALKNKLTVIVRQGDSFSTKQLYDISIHQAKSVIILGSDIQNTVCKFDYQERLEQRGNGNSQTIKTLVQVAELTASEESADNQMIIVEVDDNWTLELVNKIIEHKENLGKCNIIPVVVNKILGQILSQFSIMPELNLVYSELFSNRGATFFCQPYNSDTQEIQAISDYMSTHVHAIPITCMDTKTGPNAFFVSERNGDRDVWGEPVRRPDYAVKLKKNYWLERRNVVILGHNSKSQDIMDGFNSFRNEWNFKDGSEILNVVVIDDEKNLEKHNFYKEYPYVNKVVPADIYDKQAIYDTINEMIDSCEEDVSVLILSDDAVLADDLDAAALTYLIYVSDIVAQRIRENPAFDRESVDIVVEILNPKNYDVVHSYSVNNVVISNRYISKVVTQIGEKSALFEFYNDILTYDAADCDAYESKELYIKKVSRFFDECPAPTTAAELIRAVYDASPDDNKSIVLGYVSPGNQIVLFSGNQNKIPVTLTLQDKLIIYSNH